MCRAFAVHFFGPPCTLFNECTPLMYSSYTDDACIFHSRLLMAHKVTVYDIFLCMYACYTQKSLSELNLSVRDCLSSRATSRLIACIKNVGSDDKVRICFPEEPGFKLLTEGRECLRRRYLLRQSVQDTGSSNCERPVTDC